MVVRLSRHRLLTLLCGVLTVLTLVTPVLITPVQAVANRSDAAAGWLARQLVDGERFEVVFDGVAYPDPGLTLDAVFAFAAAGVADDPAARALAWVTRPDIRDGYLGDGTTEAYAGATAKLTLAVQVRGGDPTAVGGLDLVTRLRSLQAPNGRFTDRSAYGDYSNAFSQSFAILALARTAAGVPPTAGEWLAGTRCPDGGYPVLPGQPTCVSDVDATALAVQALRVAGRPADATAGLHWLVSVQRTDGASPTRPAPRTPTAPGWPPRRCATAADPWPGPGPEVSWSDSRSAAPVRPPTGARSTSTAAPSTGTPSTGRPPRPSSD
ncbi:peptidase [Micromonospora echinospora]